MSAIVENALLGGLIGSEEIYGVIRFVLSRLNDEIQLAKDFKKELGELQGQLTRLGYMLQGASTQSITNPLMADWLNKIKDAAYDANDLLDEWSYVGLKTRVRTRATEKLVDGVSYYAFFRRSMALKVKDMLVLLSSIYDDARDNGIKPIKVAGGEVYSGTRSQQEDEIQQRRLLSQRQCVDDQTLIGRDQDITKLLNLLCDPNNTNSDLTVIGIVGLAGLGKTTLCKRIFKAQEVTKHFNSFIVWLVVSHNFDLMNILNGMIAILFGTNENMSDIQALILKLQQKLKGNRYLLVLDDVWDTIDWEPLRSTLHDIGGSQGTTILVTSRDKDVVAKLETYSYDDDGNRILRKPFIHPLLGLGKDDSWSLFMSRINNENLDGSDKMIMATRMLKNCGGVPLAIRALGDLLRDKSIGRWKEIEESEMWAKEDQNGILPSLKLSFQYLPNTSLKKCFSFCAIFGEDEAIEKDRLIYMWMAHGFLQPCDEMERTGEEYFAILLNTSLFQEEKIDEFGKVVTFKMHDLVWTLARVVSMGECLFTDKIDGSTEVRHLSIPNFFQTDDSLKSYTSKRLQTFLYRKSYACKSLRKFLLKCSHLRVLSMGRHWRKILNRNLIGKLKHLRYLEVIADLNKKDRGSLQMLRPYIPKQVTKLYNLQTIRIRPPFPIQIVPNLPCAPCFPKRIGNLVNLRHIYIQDCSIGIPKGLGHLTNLRTLPVINLKQDWGGRLSDVGSLINLRGTLELHELNCIENEEEARHLRLGDKSDLERLVLKWESRCSEQTHQNGIIDALQPHSHLEMLQVEGYDGTRVPTWLIEKPSLLYNLSSLKLNNCLHSEGILNIENFRYLRILSVSHCNRLTVSFPYNSGFQCSKSLEVLRINGCHNVENLPNLSSLTKLRCLNICHIYANNSGCTLIGLGSSPGVREVYTDQPLVLDDLCKDSPVCKSLETLNLETDYENNTDTLPIELQHLVALKKLTIRGFIKVETLPEWLGKFTTLEKLELYSMPKLKQFPSQDAIKCLTNFKDLRISNCSCLKNDFENQSGEWFKIAHIPKIMVDNKSLKK